MRREVIKLKVKDLKNILEVVSDEAEVIIETEDNQFYDCFAEERWLMPGEKFPYLVIAKE